MASEIHKCKHIICTLQSCWSWSAVVIDWTISCWIWRADSLRWAVYWILGEVLGPITVLTETSSVAGHGLHVIMEQVEMEIVWAAEFMEGDPQLMKYKKTKVYGCLSLGPQWISGPLPQGAVLQPLDWGDCEGHAWSMPEGVSICLVTGGRETSPRLHLYSFFRMVTGMHVQCSLVYSCSQMWAMKL